MAGKFMIVNQPQLMQMIQMYQYNQKQLFKVIVLDDEVVQGPNFIQGSILLPPPSALFALIDNNDIPYYSTMYDQYLRTPEVDSFIILLATALYKGVDVLFYLNTSDPNLFLNFLCGFLSSVHGLNVSYYDPNNISINFNAIPSLLGKMLGYGYITQEEYQSNFIQEGNSPFQRVIR
jgi:hypothetical protein